MKRHVLIILFFIFGVFHIIPAYSSMSISNPFNTSTISQPNWTCDDGCPPPPPPCNAPNGFTKISTPSDLNLIRNNLSGSFFLCQNLYLQGDFEPMGVFSGILNGNGKKISGLQVNQENNGVVGFFTTLFFGSVIENLEFENPNIFGSSDVGVLAGESFSAFINQVSVTGGGVVTGNREMEFYGERIGGLIGQDQESTILNTTISGLWVTGSNNVGGLLGNAYLTYIEDTTVESNVVVDGRENVGGFAGATSYVSIQTSGPSALTGSQAYVQGDKNTVELNNIGGFIGSASYSSIDSVYAYGDVNTWGRGTNVGGLIGYLEGDSKEIATLRSSVAKGTVSGGYEVGGLIGRAIYASILNSYSQNPYVEALDDAGGLVGDFTGTPFEADIANCYTTSPLVPLEPQHFTMGALIGEGWPNSRHSFYWEDNGFYNGLGIPKPLYGDNSLTVLETYLPPWQISLTNNPAQTLWKLTAPEGTDTPQLVFEWLN